MTTTIEELRAAAVKAEAGDAAADADRLQKQADGDTAKRVFWDRLVDERERIG